MNFSKITETARLPGFEYEFSTYKLKLHTARHWNEMNSYWMFWIPLLAHCETIYWCYCLSVIIRIIFYFKHLLTFQSSNAMNATTLKTPGSEFDPERVHWGQTPFRVNDDLEISQLDAECDPELGQSDPIICQVCRKLTDFRVIFEPEWSLAPMDPFPGHADPGVFRVGNATLRQWRIQRGVRQAHAPSKFWSTMIFSSSFVWECFKISLKQNERAPKTIALHYGSRLVWIHDVLCTSFAPPA